MKLSVIGLCLVVAFATGCVTGIVASPRVNTVAVMSYAKALDLEARNRYQAQLAVAKAGFDDTLREREVSQRAALTQAKAEATSAVAATKAEAVQQIRACGDRAQRHAEAYSGEIISLRAQLAAHGIAPLVLDVMETHGESR